MLLQQLLGITRYQGLPALDRSWPDAALTGLHEAVGGDGNYSWSVVSGKLSTGFNLNSAGVISGTPRKTGTSTFTVQVTDTSSPPNTAQQELSLVIQ